MSTPVKRCAPDGGWGWVVVFASFLLQVLTVGITYTFGVIYVEFIDYFGETESATAWIGSIQPALMYFTGIVSGPLLQKFGWRLVVIVGSLISSAGLCLSYFATNIYVLYVTYGGLTGLGFGFMYVTSMATIQHYFDKRRSMATGIAVAGSGVGTLCFGFFTQFLLDNVDWRLTLVIEGCITLVVGVVSGSLLRPLPDTWDEQTHPILSAKDGRIGHNTYGTATTCSYNKASHSDLSDNSQTFVLHSSKSEDTFNEPLENQNVVEAITPQIEYQQGDCCCDCPAICGRFDDRFRFSLFKNPRLIIFSISAALFSFGYHVPFSFTPAKAIDMFDIPAQKASFLVSVMGIANVVSRLFFGWFGDRSAKVRFVLVGSVLILCGVDSMISFVFTTYPLLLVYSALFGAFAGCFVSLYPVMMVDLMGLDTIEYTLGLGMATSPVAFLVADPLSGWVINSAGYNTAFLMVGIVHVVGGLLFFTIVWLPRKHYPVSPRDRPGTESGAATFFYTETGTS